MTDPASRTCPGLHSDTQPAPGIRDDEHLCRACVGRTMHHLEQLADDLAELELTVVRQAVIRHGGTRGRARREPDDTDAPVIDEGAAVARELPLPFNERASRIRAESIGWLSQWAEYLATITGVTIPAADRGPRQAPVDAPTPRTPIGERRCRHDMVEGTCAMCAELPDVTPGDPLFVVNAAHPRTSPLPRPAPRRVSVILAVLRDKRVRNWMRTDEQGPDFAQTIAYVRRRIRTVVDRFDRRWYAGECGQPTTVIDLENDDDGNLVPVTRESRCTADLYAEPGKAVVVCDGYREPNGIGGCGAFHPAASRHNQIISTVRTRWLPIDAILATVPTLYGREIPQPGTVRLWRHRGKLRPMVCVIKHDTEARRAACRACRGELYRASDVLDLVLDDKPRPGPKRQTRAKVDA